MNNLKSLHWGEPKPSKVQKAHGKKIRKAIMQQLNHTPHSPDFMITQSPSSFPPPLLHKIFILETLSY